MARKRSFRRRRTSSKKATGPRRRRRVGAMALSATSPLVKWGSVAAGYFLGPKINEQIVKLVGDKVDAKIVGAAEAGIGFLLAMRKGRKGMLQTVGGGVLLGAGLKQLMESFGIGAIGPYGRVPVIGGAYGNMPVIGRHGYTPNHSMNGYTPSGTLGRGGKVMGSVEQGGSGYTAENAGSCYMN